MSRSLPLKIRVRYEGLFQTFDRRPKSEADADFFRSPVRRIPAITLPRRLAKTVLPRKTVHGSSNLEVPIPALPTESLVTETPTSVS